VAGYLGLGIYLERYIIGLRCGNSIPELISWSRSRRVASLVSEVGHIGIHRLDAHKETDNPTQSEQVHAQGPGALGPRRSGRPGLEFLVAV